MSRKIGIGMGAPLAVLVDRLRVAARTKRRTSHPEQQVSGDTTNLLASSHEDNKHNL